MSASNACIAIAWRPVDIARVNVAVGSGSGDRGRRWGTGDWNCAELLVLGTFESTYKSNWKCINGN